MTKIITFVLICFFLIITALHAQTPQLLNYQGKLVNKDGTVATGTFVMFFSIYSDSAGTNSLWSETHRQVLVNNGIFNVLLGSVEPFPPDLFIGFGDRFLGIQVGSEPEMRPLFRLTSVAYAIRANRADTAQVAITATSGNTLDQAYDQGGPGAGRIITADAGAVTIEGSGGLFVNGGDINGIFVELRSATPAIDFSNEQTSDYDMRIILTGDDQLEIHGGRLGIGQNNPAAELDVNGNALLGYETTVSDFGSPLKSGFYSNGSAEIPGDVPDNSHVWTHLITSRHINSGNNYQLQIASSYADNDRLYFRKVGKEINDPGNPSWHELATRGANTFSGNQYFIDGNMGIGTTDPQAKLDVAGNIKTYGINSLVQSHPSDPDKEIVHVALEGPEAGTYIRGTAELNNGEAVINLPDYFYLVTNDEGLTVQLTPRGGWLQLFVAKSSAKQIVVGEAQSKNGQFDYFVQGVRKGFENHQVIQEKKR